MSWDDGQKYSFDWRTREVAREREARIKQNEAFDKHQREVEERRRARNEQYRDQYNQSSSGQPPEYETDDRPWFKKKRYIALMIIMYSAMIHGIVSDDHDQQAPDTAPDPIEMVEPEHVVTPTSYPAPNL